MKLFLLGMFVSGVIIFISDILVNGVFKKYQGEFLVDWSDPEKDIYKINMYIPIQEIELYDEVLLKVTRIKQPM